MSSAASDREIIDLREEAADLREDAADLREVAAGLREQALRPQEQAAREKAVSTALTEAQLREANERLVVATVNAQTMSDRMAHMAQHDFLTGLPGRALLTDRLEQAIALARRGDKRVALMYVDLDDFKRINDSYGHEVGDLLLQSCANRLKTCVRVSDTVSRQGGDEFVVLLPEVADGQGAILTAEKLMEAMTEPHQVGGQLLLITLSIGISVYPDDGKDAQTMLRNADTAMYYAKRGGRNNCQVFTPEMNARAGARQSVEAALHRALAQDEFILHYQPQVNLETGVVTGVEALIRMQSSDRRLVYPAEFVGVAEECGLILSIGRWVLHEACKQAQTWVLAGQALGRIAVNVSAKELHGREFLGGVLAILRDTGLDPCHLELELTESGLIQDFERTKKTLFKLKDLGVQIAVDDFGTGYSSLSHLRRFPIDTLKIDQSFVQDIDGETGRAIVGAVIAMGTSLKLRVVAEGVETREQNAFLQARQCAEGQGYLFARPAAAGDQLPTTSR